MVCLGCLGSSPLPITRSDSHADDSLRPSDCSMIRAELRYCTIATQTIAHKELIFMGGAQIPFEWSCHWGF